MSIIKLLQYPETVLFSENSHFIFTTFELANEIKKSFTSMTRHLSNDPSSGL